MTVGELFNGLAYVVGGLVFWLAARANRTATRGIAVVVMAGLIAAVFGAKLTQLVFEGWPFRVPMEAALDPRNGGRALLGGLIFGWIGVEIAKRRLGIRRSTGDLFALALPAGEAVGRIGCYLNGCCYGRECDLPWAIYQHGALRHPAQLYSAVVAALTFVFLLWLWLRSHPLPSRGEESPASHPLPSGGEGRRSRCEGRLAPPLNEGTIFRIYLAIFASTRFGLEFLRNRDSLLLGLSPMQWFCLEMLIGLAVLTAVDRRRAKVAI